MPFSFSKFAILIKFYAQIAKILLQGSLQYNKKQGFVYFFRCIHISQYDFTVFKAICNSSGDSAKITVSSA